MDPSDNGRVAMLLPEVVVNNYLGPTIQQIIDLARPYNTIILLYGDDFNGKVLAAWAELDRLKLSTQRVGVLENGIEVHTFGLDHFPPDSVVELSVRETSLNCSRQDPQRIAYKSLLNEMVLISVKVFCANKKVG